MNTRKPYRKSETGEIILPGPRSTNEIFISSKTESALPNNEKDASTFSLVSESAALASLKSLYHSVENFSYPFKD